MPKEELMRHALALARQHNPAPNPRVGAVVASGIKIIGEGAHHKAGEAHAEVLAIRAAGAGAKGAGLYVTLEPCCHSGSLKQTPPCTALIRKSGIKRVFISSLDPNPEVSGRGIAVLRDAGIQVEYGILDAEERILNREYHHFRKSGLPWVHLKQAVSLDGCISEKKGERTRLSCREALFRVHQMRAANQAVLCGGSTVITDDPELTVRHVRGRSPLRMVLEGREEIPLDAKVFNTALSETVLYPALQNEPRFRQLRAKGVRIIPAISNRLKDILTDAGDRGIISIFVEAGGKLAKALFEEDLVDEVSMIYSPRILGDGLPMVSGASVSFDGQWTMSSPEILGTDVLLNYQRREDS